MLICFECDCKKLHLEFVPNNHTFMLVYLLRDILGAESASNTAELHSISA